LTIFLDSGNTKVSIVEGNDSLTIKYNPAILGPNTEPTDPQPLPSQEEPTPPPKPLPIEQPTNTEGNTECADNNLACQTTTTWDVNWNEILQNADKNNMGDDSDFELPDQSKIPIDRDGETTGENT
jgi:hypothetical protein